MERRNRTSRRLPGFGSKKSRPRLRSTARAARGESDSLTQGSPPPLSQSSRKLRRRSRASSSSQPCSLARRRKRGIDVAAPGQHAKRILPEVADENDHLSGKAPTIVEIDAHHDPYSVAALR